MDATGSPLGPARLARVLGPWRVVEGPDPARHPARRALADRIRSLILDGRIAVGARLPAERAAQRDAAGEPDDGDRGVRDAGRAGVRHGAARLRHVHRVARRLLARSSGGWQYSDDPDVLDLTCAAPPMPTAELRAATAWAAERLPLVGARSYLPYGLAELREAVADRYTLRGLPTLPDQILVTAGAQGAISLVGRLLLRGGDRVLVEGPSFPNALDSLTASRARLSPVPLDDAGWADGSAAGCRWRRRPSGSRRAWCIRSLTSTTRPGC